MTPLKRFGRKSTASEVLDGLDLTGRTFLVTGCATGIGFETMRGLAESGGHVVGTARSIERAQAACDKIAGATTAMACDQDDFASVAAAAKNIRALGLRLDGIIANAGIMVPPGPDLRYGVESQFRVNHLSHMLLVTQIVDLLPDGTGRLVMVSSSAAQDFAPKEGIRFNNLDTHDGYKPFAYYGQSKLANLCLPKQWLSALPSAG